MAAAANPRSTSSSATLAAVRLVLVKMMVPAAAAGLQDAGHNLDLVHAVGTVDQLADVALGEAFVVRVGGADVRVGCVM